MLFSLSCKVISIVKKSAFLLLLETTRERGYLQMPQAGMLELSRSIRYATEVERSY